MGTRPIRKKVLTPFLNGSRLPLIIIAAVVFLFAGANAQELLPSDSSQTHARLKEVVVTGSRIPVTSEEGPQAARIYSRDQIDQAGATTVSDFLNTLPDVSLSTNENGFQTLSGTTTVQLHGLPVGSTLVLINGRRVESSGAAQVYGLTYFDLNTIPVAAIDHIEVVSQGSSAIYGSDAIGGIVNFVLKQDFNGFEADSRYGFASGTHDSNLDLVWGHAGDRSHLS